MSVNAAQVKELRDKTGAGMMDCKNALIEADGNFEKAIEVLRKKGASVAAKRADKSANEGMIIAKAVNNNTAVLVEVNCETDFVANSKDFIDFANLVADTVVANLPASVEELLEINVNGFKVAEILNEVTGKVGEKVAVSRIKIEKAIDGVVVDYVHHGSKLAVLVRIDNIGNGDASEIFALGKDFAMQVAAMSPSYVNRDVVPQSVIDKEIEIYKEIAKKEGKPEQILEKIAVGRLTKFYQENCLVEQASVKDNSKTVGDFVKEYNKKYSAEAKVVNFHRCHLSDENK